MRIWIMIFSAAVFAGGTCLGVALHPRIAPKPAPSTAPPSEPWGGWRGAGELSLHGFESQLDLGEEQQLELERIMTETQRDFEVMGRNMRYAHERSRDAIKKLLSEEQRKKLDELVADERRKRSESEIRKSVEAYTRILALSEAQARGLQEAFVESKAKRREAYEKHRGDRSQFRAIRDDQNRRVEKALTPEQFKQYLEIQNLTEDRRGS
jgi:Spy/CpxP family protein refolding chaperone